MDKRGVMWCWWCWMPLVLCSCRLTRLPAPHGVQVRLQAALGGEAEGDGGSDSHGGRHGQGENTPLKPSSQMALEAQESPLVKIKESVGGLASLYEGVCELPRTTLPRIRDHAKVA